MGAQSPCALVTGTCIPEGLGQGSCMYTVPDGCLSTGQLRSPSGCTHEVMQQLQRHVVVRLTWWSQRHAVVMDSLSGHRVSWWLRTHVVLTEARGGHGDIWWPWTHTAVPALHLAPATGDRSSFQEQAHPPCHAAGSGHGPRTEGWPLPPRLRPESSTQSGG